VPLKIRVLQRHTGQETEQLRSEETGFYNETAASADPDSNQTSIITHPS
jgi:hypothetical protein